MISDFWDALSQAYIDYLQAKIDLINKELNNLSNIIKGLKFELKQIDKEIEIFDKKNMIEVNNLIKLTDRRLDAVSNVYLGTVNSHLNELNRISVHIDNLHKDKQDKYINAANEFEKFKQDNPHEKDGTYSALQNKVNEAKTEFDAVNQLFKKHKEFIEETKQKVQSHEAEIRDIKEKAQIAQSFEDKQKIAEVMQSAVDKFKSSHADFVSQSLQIKDAMLKMSSTVSGAEKLHSDIKSAEFVDNKSQMDEAVNKNKSAINDCNKAIAHYSTHIEKLQRKREGLHTDLGKLTAKAEALNKYKDKVEAKKQNFEIGMSKKDNITPPKPPSNDSNSRSFKM